MPEPVECYGQYELCEQFRSSGFGLVDLLILIVAVTVSVVAYAVVRRWLPSRVTATAHMPDPETRVKEESKALRSGSFAAMRAGG